jgi:hypothetical protein
MTNLAPSTPNSDRPAVDDLPGYRRRLRVEAGEGAVVALLEDDYHCMSVTLEHDGERVTKVVPVMYREPWTTCPGAIVKLRETFTGVALSEVTARRDKQQNCTHLHDLAVLAASRANNIGSIVFDIFASDAIAGRRILEIRRNGARLLRWLEQDGLIVEPESAAGRSLMTLRDWIAGLPGEEREAARLLQWGAIVAHGRALPPGSLDSAQGMPPNCYSFQPERIGQAKRIGKILDFSAGNAQPLDGVGGERLAKLRG